MDTSRLMLREQMLDRENPYPGLQAFGELDHGFFYGRDRERAELFRLVRRHVLTTCFGASGLGKSSLLAAGLFPRLRQERFFPIPIRLDFSPGADLVGQVPAATAREVAEHGVEASAAGDGETLWEYFHRAAFWDARSHLLTPVLVFDQFEEIFTLGRSDPRVPELVTALADLIENRIPGSVRERMKSAAEELPFTYDEQHYRVLLSFREDFLPQFEDLKRSIPSLGRGRFRLTPMDGEQALAAVVEPGRGLVSEEVAAEIVYFAAGAPAGEDTDAGSRPELAGLEVEPALLALVCRELNESRKQEGADVIGMSLLRGGRERIYDEFYESCIADLPAAVAGFIEERLLTSSGFRTAAALEEAQGAGVSEEHVGKLVDRRVLRLSDRLGIPHVELIHDVLCRVVRESRDRRREKQELRRLRWRMLAVAAVVLAVFAGLALWGTSQARLRQEAVLEKAGAERSAAFVLGFTDKLAGLQDPTLMNALAQDLRSYVEELPEDRRRQDTARLLAAKVGFLQGQAALLRSQTGDAELALAKFQDYRAEIERELERDPEHPVWSRELATALQAEGDALQDLDRTEAARKAYERSRQLLERLGGRERSSGTALDLAAVERKIGDTYTREQRAPQAAEAYGRARRRVEAYAGNSRDIDVRQELRKIESRLEKLAPERQLPPAPKRFVLERKVYDAGNGRELPGELVRGEGDPAAGDPAVDVVYRTLGDFHRFLKEVFGRNSLDDRGMPLVATVHYGENYPNAFWDGSQVVLGDGDGKLFLDFARSPGTVAHELGTGLAQLAVGFRYQRQSGVLAVHFGDVFAVLFDQWRQRQPVSEASWLVGADVVGPAYQGRALRSLEAPGAVDHVERYVDEGDGADIYRNVGIPNRAFYLTATTLGGYAWESAGGIWYRALLELEPNSDFRDFAEHTWAVATEEHGDGSRERAAVRRGWAAVGIAVGS